jgi:hypothetical protein
VPPASVSFDGIGSFEEPLLTPPDTNGDVGATQFLQIVNKRWSVWTKTGIRLRPAMSEATPWSSKPRHDFCRTHDFGDPVVVYDALAGRWLLSFFAFQLDDEGEPLRPFFECVAVSRTSDALGSWCAYSFRMDGLSRAGFPDYPKFGVWPDGYYMTANVFGPQNRAGALGVVFERSRMLRCKTARSRGWIVPHAFGMLPADLDGTTPPPAGSPGLFVIPDTRRFALRLYRLSARWSRRSAVVSRPIVIPVAQYNADPCTDPGGLCIVQPGSSARLDALAHDQLMYRLAYRNFGDHESLLVNQTVSPGGATPSQAAIRFYEIRNPRGSPVLYQQGTYSPDADSRWLGSAAFDKVGDIAVLFNVSSSSTYPSLRYSARAPTDPLGSLAQGEATLMPGGGSLQPVFGVTLGRWGDYAELSTDPTDDCTFWFTGEYVPSSMPATDWRTRIGAFRLPGCS